MALDGIVLDLDGTLVDTNATHVEAWRRVLADKGYTIAADRIFDEVGKGGDKLVPSLLGREADGKDGDALRKAQPKAYTELARRNGLKVFPQVRELLGEFRRRGLKTVLATSSNEQQLNATLEISGLPVRELVDEVVGADDAEQSKPAPDIVAAAAKKLGMSPAQCAMLGDTPYDAESAKHAGVVCLGLLCGGHEPQTLLRAGARATYRDAADLLAKLDDALRTASPGPARLTQPVLESLMREALAAARRGLDSGEMPVGCVLARGDLSVVARGHNELNASQDKTAHAETVTFRRAAGRVPPEARDLVLVTTLEPCVMCLGASMEAAVDTIVYGLKAPADSGTGRVQPPQSPESQMPRIVGDVLAAESRALFQEWMRKPGEKNPSQVAFVEQLLDLTR